MGRTRWGLTPDMGRLMGHDWRPTEALTPPCHNTCSPVLGGTVWEGDCSSSGSSSPSMISSLLMAPQWYLRPDSPPDQPLDLSAKAKPGQSPGPSSQPSPPIKLPALPKHIFKAKPRLTAVTGRKAYTEDELQAALRDIQSGRLGTRRAAVIYGIPRSTLRNKVYKMSQERRDAPKEEDEEEEEMSPDDEEKEMEKVLRKQLRSLEDVMRLTQGRPQEAIPYLQQMLQGQDKDIPEAVRNLFAEDRQAKHNGEDRLKSLSTSPPSSPPKQRLATASQTLLSQQVRNINNNHIDDKKLEQQGTSKQQQTTGKGTRPKRGKYRNYDRDSLVEAVRAVQRGEMSVHRAGSYYGVPHSTLEYKVKERHLMRPRKREPKLQNSIQEEVKRKEEAEKRAATTVRPPRVPFSGPVPPSNGLKLGLFDPSALATYPGAPPFPFWPGHPFTSLPLTDFPRPPDIFPSQMIQRLQEEQAASTSALGKTTREVAESLYDGTGENGSFLDGIIRSSLETGLPSKEGSKGGLIEQLCRGSELSTPKANSTESCSPPHKASPPPSPSSCDTSPKET